MLSDIIGFFQREQKPQWRLHFDRKDLSDSELIDDREVIANMKLASVFQDKKSFVYKYKFPEQEYKLKEGRKCIIANNTDPDRSDYAGKIQELDQFERSLLLRKGISKEEKILKMKKRRRKLIARALKSATKGMIEELKLIGKDEKLRELCDGKGNTLLHRYVLSSDDFAFRKNNVSIDKQSLRKWKSCDGEIFNS